MKNILTINLSTLLIVFTFLGGNGLTSNEFFSSVEDDNIQYVESNDLGSCKQYLKDYQAFADQFVKVSKKYNENPEDPTLVKEYTDLASKAMKWTEEAPDDCNALQKVKMVKITTQIAGAMK